jgi:predicted small secreted protein
MRENFMNIAKLALLLIVGSFAVTGCESDDGAAERAGENLDEAGEKLQDAARDAGNAVEDACEDVKEGVDAEDTDC